jgi:hypothetical protein
VADEDKEEQEEQQDEKPAGVDRAEYDRLKAENERLTRQNQDYEYNLLDPEYINWVANKGKVGARQQQQEERKEEVDFESMSKKDLVDYILNGTKKMVQEGIAPIDSKINMNTYVTQVKECMGKYTDYLDYKDEMIQTAKQHPTLSADEVYHLTKSRVSARPKKQPARTEVPSNRERGERIKEKKGFDGAFDSAWKDVFGAKDSVG